MGIPAIEPPLEAEVAPPFWRCWCFIVVDLEINELKALNNTNATAANGTCVPQIK